MARIEPTDDRRYRLHWRENGRHRRRTFPTENQAAQFLTDDVKARLQGEWRDARDRLEQLQSALRRAVGPHQFNAAIETITADPTSELGTAISAAHAVERNAWDNVSRV